MTPPYRKNDFFRDVAWVAAIAIAAYALTRVPYVAAKHAAPPGSIFIGQIAVADDVNSYFSFMRQAAQGHWVFRNTMTYIDHAPVFVNVEFLFFGKLMGWFGWSPPTLFEVWRAIGVLTLIAAFVTLTRVLLQSEFQRRVALIMCAFGGGFGWLLTILAHFHLLDLHSRFEVLNPALDLNTGIQPFEQMARNPHFSLPHGTFLLIFAAMIYAERNRRARWYGVAAVIAVIHGLMRPYDLISLFAIVPAFVLLECARTRTIDWRWNVVRCAPLVLTAPLLLYYVYLFSFHPVFKFWASQGGHPAPIPVRWHLLSLGIPLVLFVARAAIAPWRPIGSVGERLVLVWGACLVVLFHAYRVVPFMPYTPQLAVPSVTPLIVIGVTLLPPLRGMSPAKRWRWIALGALLVCVDCLSTPIYLRQESRNVRHEPQLYIREADVSAVAWLNKHIDESDVVLAQYAYGTRISQYLNARVAVGHWALSPHVNDLKPRIDKFLDGHSSPEEAESLLQEIKPRYIYVTYDDGARIPEYFRTSTSLHQVYGGCGVAIFERRVS